MDFLYQVDSLMDPADYPHGQPLPDSPYVELSWYCPDRTTPIAPYDSLIAGYAGLEGQLKADAERYMDEWFTRDEVAQLLTYLCIELGHTVSVRRLPVPMNIFLDSGGLGGDAGRTGAGRPFVAGRPHPLGCRRWVPAGDRRERLLPGRTARGCGGRTWGVRCPLRFWQSASLSALRLSLPTRPYCDDARPVSHRRHH